MQTLIGSLEKRKRLYAGVFLAVSVLLLLPVLILAPDDLVRVLAGALLAAHTAVAISWFFGGLARAASVAVYCLLFIAFTVLSVILRRFVHLPVFLDDGVFTAFGSFGMVLFVLVIPLPALARQAIEARLAPLAEPAGLRQAADPAADRSEGPSVSPAAMAAREASLPAREATYQAYRQYKLRMRYERKPYHLAHATRPQARWRLAASGILFGAGCLGLALGSNLAGPVSPALPALSALWLTPASVTLLLTGCAILLLGFLRALLVPAAGAVLLLLAPDVLTRLPLMAAASLPLFAVLMAGILVLALSGAAALVRLLVWFRRTLTFFEKDDAVYAADLDLKDFCPIDGYTTLVISTLDMDEETRPKSIDRFLDKLATFCSRQRIVLAGVIINRYRKTLQLAVYARSGEARETIDRFLARSLASPFRSEPQADPKWDYFQVRLFPGKPELIRLQNDALMEAIATRKDSFQDEQPIVIGIYFPDRENAAAFQENAGRSGFDRTALFDAAEDDHDDARDLIAEGKRYLVLIQRQARVTLDWLNTACLGAYELARQYGGEYDAMDLGEIAGELGTEKADGPVSLEYVP